MLSMIPQKIPVFNRVLAKLPNEKAENAPQRGEAGARRKNEKRRSSFGFSARLFRAASRLSRKGLIAVYKIVHKKTEAFMK